MEIFNSIFVVASMFLLKGEGRIEKFIEKNFIFVKANL